MFLSTSTFPVQYSTGVQVVYMYGTGCTRMYLSCTIPECLICVHVPLSFCLWCRYVIKWLEGAKKVYNLDIDYIGMWNERYCQERYILILRKALDKAGFNKTLIVADDLLDPKLWICKNLLKWKEAADAVGVIGTHYLDDFSNNPDCRSLNKPFWASEEASSFDDANGAACWARIMTSHWVLRQVTGSIMWNLVGSYYHGTNWYASSMLTAVQPWSGHYWVAPVVWATAHVTQFTKVGWKYLKNGAGSGMLLKGGYFSTWVDPDGKDFTIVIVKISREHGSCTRPALPPFYVAAENVTFRLDPSLGKVDVLNMWYSNFEDGPPYTVFRKEMPVKLSERTFTLPVPVGGYYTLTTLSSGNKGAVGTIPNSDPKFPLPYADDFDSVSESQEARYFSDQIGAFEVHNASLDAKKRKGVMKQMVPNLPVGWSDHGSRGPMTALGMREWQDVKVEVDFLLPESAPKDAAACLATRSDQMWDNAIVFCMHASGNYTLATKGPTLHYTIDQQREKGKILHKGSLEQFESNVWHHMTLTTVDDRASASLDGHGLFVNVAIPNTDTGFVALGSNGWFSIQYDHFEVDRAGPRWTTPSGCGEARVGSVLTTRDCVANGLTSADQEFDLLPNYQLRHRASGLCATAQYMDFGSDIVLRACSKTNSKQIMSYDYTLIRNRLQHVKLGSLYVSASKQTKRLSLEEAVIREYWQEWTYFPNTKQLRNQYTAVKSFGYPQCLSTCPPTHDVLNLMHPWLILFIILFILSLMFASRINAFASRIIEYASSIVAFTSCITSARQDLPLVARQSHQS